MSLMNLTAVIESYTNATPKTRGFISIGIAILIYAGFRYLIYVLNKNAQTIPKKKPDWKDNLKSMAGQD